MGRMPQLGQTTVNPTTASTISSIPTSTTPAVNSNVVIGLKVTPTPNPGEFRITQEKSGGSATITAQDYADLQRKLAAIQKAHEIGKGHSLGEQNSDGTFKKNEEGLAYTPEEIAQKARILKEAGFTQEERGELIKYGVAGTKQQLEAKKMPFKETPLPHDSEVLLLYSGLGQLFEKLSDSDWGVRQAAAQAIGEIIARCGIDLTRINHYQEELLNPEGEFGLKEEELSEGYLIVSFLLGKEEDFGLWLNFTDSTEQDFSRLTSSLAGSIMSGAAEEAIGILKEKRSIKEANLSLEELLLKRAGLRPMLQK